MITRDSLSGYMHAHVHNRRERDGAGMVMKGWYYQACGHRSIMPRPVCPVCGIEGRAERVNNLVPGMVKVRQKAKVEG